MTVDGMTYNAAPATVPPKGAAGRSLCACGHSVGRGVPSRPLTSGRHEHTGVLGVGRRPSQAAFERAPRMRCEEAMRLDMRTPQPEHGRTAGAASRGSSACGRAHRRRLHGGAVTATPGRTTSRSLPRFGPVVNENRGGGRRAFQEGTPRRRPPAPARSGPLDVI